MKLNMIVVMTTWLPRRAWSQPGTKAHAAPHSAAASDRRRDHQAARPAGGREGQERDARPAT